uniref:Uncharacterized protein n=1 Tax=Arundo donax TaxID=35708 RepID=A0A0A9BUR6_ARUDO
MPTAAQLRSASSSSSLVTWST